MKTISSLILMIALGSSLVCQAQPLHFKTSKGLFVGEDIAEHYDKGYILIPRGFHFSVRKLTINKEILWTKMFVDKSGRDLGFLKLIPTFDGGIAIAGDVYQQKGLHGEPAFFMKLNACGEPEWSKTQFFNLFYGADIVQLNDSSFVSMASGSINGKYMIVFSGFSNSGQLLWVDSLKQAQKCHPNDYGTKLILLNDNNLLLQSTEHYTGKTSLIKLDQQLNVIWRIIPTGDNDFLFTSTKENNYGNFFSTGKKVSISYPSIMNFNAGGEVQYCNRLNLSYSDPVQESSPLVVFNDTTLITGYEFGYNYLNFQIRTGYLAVIDTIGNVKNEIVLYPQGDGSWGPGVIYKTSDNKILANYLSSGTEILGKFKLNGQLQLEPDSIDPQPIVYDSLCNHTINSDTIIIDPENIPIVGLSEHSNDSEALSIYPIPCDNILCITVNEVTRNVIELKIINIMGQELKSKNIPSGGTFISFETSDLQPGIYLLQYKNGHTSCLYYKFIKE